MLFREYYETSSLGELFEALLAKGVEDTVTVENFLRQFESPYLALQMIIYAMIMNKVTDVDAVKVANFKEFANYGNGKNKMTAFLASTTFPIDFAQLFKKMFPEAGNNTVLWAKEHKDIVTNLDNPKIRQLITELVSKFIN